MSENMSEKKSFFSSLEPKSAMLVGIVGGVLVICAIGFFITLGILLSKGEKTDNTATPPANEQVTPTVTKSDRPVVELFVMSHCPYGLQMEKALLPAWTLLSNKADISVKFVYYAMHGQKELEEQTRQYCIEKEQAGKFIAYLGCFAKAGDSASCLAQTKVDQSKMTACVGKTDKEFGIMAKFNDQSTWLSGQFPLFPIYNDLNERYGVQGSPTLVINGAQVESGRSPEAVKQAICASFNNPPSECGTALSTQAAGAGFGDTAGTDASAGCGT